MLTIINLILIIIIIKKNKSHYSIFISIIIINIQPLDWLVPKSIRTHILQIIIYVLILSFIVKTAISIAPASCLWEVFTPFWLNLSKFLNFDMKFKNIHFWSALNLYTKFQLYRVKIAYNLRNWPHSALLTPSP